jgi:hypothetical protein
MARPEFGPPDLDQPYQIVFGIAQPLRRGETTEIDRATIENCYRMVEESDDGDTDVDGPLETKCDDILNRLHEFEVEADHTIGHSAIRFRPKPR